MSLFIRDAKVDALAEEVRKLAHVKTKTEAVRLALQSQLDALNTALPLRDRLAKAKALADSMGPSAPEFDMKAFSDTMWDKA